MTPIHSMAAALAALILSACGGGTDLSAHDTTRQHVRSPAELQAPLPDGPPVTHQRFVSQTWSETEGGPPAR